MRAQVAAILVLVALVPRLAVTTATTGSDGDVNHHRYKEKGHENNVPDKFQPLNGYHDVIFEDGLEWDDHGLAIATVINDQRSPSTTAVELEKDMKIEDEPSILLHGNTSDLYHQADNGTVIHASLTGTTLQGQVGRPILSPPNAPNGTARLAATLGRVETLPFSPPTESDPSFEEVDPQAELTPPTNFTESHTDRVIHESSAPLERDDTLDPASKEPSLDYPKFAPSTIDVDPITVIYYTSPTNAFTTLSPLDSTVQSEAADRSYVIDQNLVPRLNVPADFLEILEQGEMFPVDIQNDIQQMTTIQSGIVEDLSLADEYYREPEQVLKQNQNFSSESAEIISLVDDFSNSTESVFHSNSTSPPEVTDFPVNDKGFSLHNQRNVTLPTTTSSKIVKGEELPDGMFSSHSMVLPEVVEMDSHLTEFSNSSKTHGINKEGISKIQQLLQTNDSDFQPSNKKSRVATGHSSQNKTNSEQDTSICSTTSDDDGSECIISQQSGNEPTKIKCPPPSTTTTPASSIRHRCSRKPGQTTTNPTSEPTTEQETEITTKNLHLTTHQRKRHRTHKHHHVATTTQMPLSTTKHSKRHTTTKHRRFHETTNPTLNTTTTSQSPSTTTTTTTADSPSTPTITNTPSTTTPEEEHTTDEDQTTTETSTPTTITLPLTEVLPKTRMYEPSERNSDTTTEAVTDDPIFPSNSTTASPIDEHQPQITTPASVPDSLNDTMSHPERHLLTLMGDLLTTAAQLVTRAVISNGTKASSVGQRIGNFSGDDVLTPQVAYDKAIFDETAMMFKKMLRICNTAVPRIFNNTGNGNDLKYYRSFPMTWDEEYYVRCNFDDPDVLARECTLAKCPTGEIFDPDTKVCKCTLDKFTASIPCPEENGYFPYLSYKDKYLECVEGEGTVRDCPEPVSKKSASHACKKLASAWKKFDKTNFDNSVIDKRMIKQLTSRKRYTPSRK